MGVGPVFRNANIRHSDANGSIMYSTHEAELDFPALSPAARHIHILPDLQNHTLISIGKLCDAGCDVIFDATTVTVRYKNNIALTGTCTQATCLWQLRASTPMEYANTAVGSATPVFSPSLSTLESALTTLLTSPASPPKLSESTRLAHTPWSKGIWINLANTSARRNRSPLLQRRMSMKTN